MPGMVLGRHEGGPAGAGLWWWGWLLHGDEPLVVDLVEGDGVLAEVGLAGGADSYLAVAGVEVAVVEEVFTEGREVGA